MPINRGKKFEERVKSDWKRTLPGSFIFRIPDQQSGYGGSKNPSDFIAFKSPNLYLLECKSIKGNTISFSYLSQYDQLISYKDLDHVFPGFVIWWIDKDKVGWVPVETVEKLKAEGKKSVHVDILSDDSYFTISIPTELKRVYLTCDFSCMADLKKEDIL